eukprot:g9104.t1
MFDGGGSFGPRVDLGGKSKRAAGDRKQFLQRQQREREVRQEKQRQLQAAERVKKCLRSFVVLEKERRQERALFERRFGDMKRVLLQNVPEKIKEAVITGLQTKLFGQFLWFFRAGGPPPRSTASDSSGGRADDDVSKLVELLELIVANADSRSWRVFREDPPRVVDGKPSPAESADDQLLLRWSKLVYFFLCFLHQGIGHNSSQETLTTGGTAMPSTTTRNCAAEILTVLEGVRSERFVKRLSRMPQLFHFLRDVAGTLGSNPLRRASLDKARLAALWQKYSPVEFAVAEEQVLGLATGVVGEKQMVGILYNENEEDTPMDVDDGAPAAAFLKYVPHPGLHQATPFVAVCEFTFSFLLSKGMLADGGQKAFGSAEAGGTSTTGTAAAWFIHEVLAKIGRPYLRNKELLREYLLHYVTYSFQSVFAGSRSRASSSSSKQGPLSPKLGGGERTTSASRTRPQSAMRRALANLDFVREIENKWRMSSAAGSSTEQEVRRRTSGINLQTAPSNAPSAPSGHHPSSSSSSSSLAPTSATAVVDLKYLSGLQREKDLLRSKAKLNAKRLVQQMGAHGNLAGDHPKLVLLAATGNLWSGLKYCVQTAASAGGRQVSSAARSSCTGTTTTNASSSSIDPAFFHLLDTFSLLVADDSSLEELTPFMDSELRQQLALKESSEFVRALSDKCDLDDFLLCYFGSDLTEPPRENILTTLAFACSTKGSFLQKLAEKVRSRGAEEWATMLKEKIVGGAGGSSRGRDGQRESTALYVIPFACVFHVRATVVDDDEFFSSEKNSLHAHLDALAMLMNRVAYAFLQSMDSVTLPGGSGLFGGGASGNASSDEEEDGDARMLDAGAAESGAVDKFGFSSFGTTSKEATSGASSNNRARALFNLVRVRICGLARALYDKYRRREEEAKTSLGTWVKSWTIAHSGGNNPNNPRRSNWVLTELPHTIPFQDRVAFLQEWIRVDHAERGAQRNQFEVLMGTRHNIRRTHIVEDGYCVSADKRITLI